MRGHFGIKKVGHTGTLDPFASGVLLILTGKATKKSEALTGMEKQYLAEIEFGIETDSYDIDGKITKTCDELPNINQDQIESELKSFVGDIKQIPPMFSAVKYKGRRLYKYARQGIKVDLNPRKVRIEKINLVSFEWPCINIDVTCSKGTYIRSLANDLGKKIGTGAYLKSLVRTRIGPYYLKDSYELNDLLKLREV